MCASLQLPESSLFHSVCSLSTGAAVALFQEIRSANLKWNKYLHLLELFLCSHHLFLSVLPGGTSLNEQIPTAQGSSSPGADPLSLSVLTTVTKVKNICQPIK